MLSEKQTQVLDTIEVYRKDPALFFKDVLGITTLEQYHLDVLEIVAREERIAIAACHDVGKSYLMARIVIWFVICHPYSKVITTAPTYLQIEKILWSEIRSAYSRAKFPLGGKLNLTDWQMSKEGDWFAIGFNPQNEVSGGEGQGTQSTFQGFHAEGGILVVFDEATGIKINIWNMVEGILTQQHVKFCAIGNPTSRNSEFFRCFKSSAWAKVKLSCFNSPNLISNGVTGMPELLKELSYVKTLTDDQAQLRMRSYSAPRPYLITLKWVIASILKWGIKHPLSVGKIFGEFPEEGYDTLITLGSIEAAQRRLYFPKEFDRKIVGCDIARFGSDSTVLTVMHGKKVCAKKVLIKRDTVYVTGAIIDFAYELFPDVGPDILVVDETGIGSGVVDMLNEAKREGRLPRNCQVRGVHFGGGVDCDGGDSCEHKDCDKAQYGNLKARMFDLLGDDMKADDGLMLLDEAIYLEELPTILYRFDSKGRKWIESKDEFKKRTGRGSPDHADSLALANFGRYDEGSVGSFTKSGDDSGSSSVPFAPSLGASRQW